MPRRIMIVCACAVIGGALALLLWLSPLPAQGSAPAVLTTEGMQTVLVILTTQAQFQMDALPPEPVARRAAVVAQLQSTASAGQSDVRRQLAQWQAEGRVHRVRPYWIINGLLVEGSADVLAQLAQRPDVARITPDARLQLISTSLQLADPPALPWGVAQIGALKTQAGLGLDGHGVTIASMDTGVDWEHPALAANYRGRNGDHVEHNGNWYDAISPTNTIPFDPHGHGTHVMGTAVGQLGVGVAPGARWIAMRIFDANGFTTLSAIHAGFEWLLAPGGDPARAPDIVNGSWGSEPYSPEWLPDVAALRAAGILPVFAAGNAGPFSMTVGAPAAYTGTLAVGASDDRDAVAWFSSVGPSVWTNQSRPALVAPGTAVLSAFPGGRYALANGTSMAAPHVSGAAALLWQANPTLSAEHLTHILTATARPLGARQPNPVSGWGRLDIYAAATTQTPHGRLLGLVSNQGEALPGVVVTITTPGGVGLPFTTDANGIFRADLQAGLYRIDAALFGYAPRSANAVVRIGVDTWQPLALTPLPGGVLQGRIFDLGTGAPLTATIMISGAPARAEADAAGVYTLTLPAGHYAARVERNGYRLGRLTFDLTPGQTLGHDFGLMPAPSILLVDDGQWYYASRLAYFRAALTAADYAFTEWDIRNPVTDIPTLADLTPYDTLVWSSPDYAPGVVGAGVVISHYLGAGGNLLISGQDVAHYDGAGLGAQRWWYRLLRGVYEGEAAAVTVTGAADSLFDGLAFTLNGGSSAANQHAPDYVAPATGSLTHRTLTYDHGRTAGLAGGQCSPFRIVYLGFGLEGVSAAADRRALVTRSLDYFTSPRVAAGVQFTSPPIERYARPDRILTYSLSVRNLSEEITDTLNLAVTGGTWGYQLLTPTLTLGPCASGQTLITVTVPDGLPPGDTEAVTLTVTSAADPAQFDSLSLRHRTPRNILLVADHRWYDPSPIYRGLLDDWGVAYDYWEIGPHGEVLGSPSADMLAAYDIVLWFTGYDWFAPIVSAERDALGAYLAQGGRLFLTSQDYLYYHQHDALTRDYLGIIGYHESITPTRVFFVADPDLPGAITATAPLTYGLYQNFSDGLLPAPTAEVALWHNAGQPGAVANRSQTWRSLFWGLPFETLAPDVRGSALNQIVGWLGDLGDSSFAADRRVIPAGASTWHTYTLAVRHLPDAPTDFVSLTVQLPPGLRVDSQGLPPDVIYLAKAQQLRWSGQLAGGAQYSLTYRAQAPDAPPGSRLHSRASLFYARHGLTYERELTIWVGAPDLDASRLAVTPSIIQPQGALTMALQLANAAGATPASTISASVYFPPETRPLTETLSAASGVAALSENHLTWRGSLAPGATTTVTLSLTATSGVSPQRLPFLAVIDAGQGDLILRPVFARFEPFHAFFPLVARR